VTANHGFTFDFAKKDLSFIPGRGQIGASTAKRKLRDADLYASSMAKKYLIREKNRISRINLGDIIININGT
jgi:hypothetical protein